MKYVFILTARGHTVDEFIDGLKELKKRGLIKNIPLRNNLYLATNPELNPKNLPMEEFKAQKITKLLDELPSGGTLHFMDDSEANVKKILESLSQEIA